MLSLLPILLSALAMAGDPCPIGLDLYEYTPEWRDRDADLGALTTKRRWLGFSFHSRGDAVVVKSVVAEGPMARAGVKVGDRLVKVGGVLIGQSGDVDSGLNGPQSVDTVDLEILRDGTPMTLSVKRGFADPVLLGMVNALEKTDCRHPSVKSLSDAQRAAVAAGAFTPERGFRCDDAHVALSGAFDSGSVVMVRGGKRILLTVPGWGTKCVFVADHDGDRFTSERLIALIESAASAYLQDRHDNP